MLRVGIVGIGMMGRMHLKCYRQMPDVKVVALCDIDKTKFNEQTVIAGNLRGSEIPLDLTGAELFHDFEDMLDKANLDAVSITVPTHIHRDYTVMALNRGVHVLCEKPWRSMSRAATRWRRPPRKRNGSANRSLSAFWPSI
jgi:predicted dehydrogenase